MAICSYLTTFKPPLSLWNIGKHCHLHWKIPCKVDHVLVFIHPYFRYSQGIAFQCNTQVWQVRLVSSFQMSNSRTGQYFYFTSTLPGLDQEERMSGKVAYFFKLYAFLLKCSHFWSPYSFTRWTATTSTFQVIFLEWIRIFQYLSFLLCVALSQVQESKGIFFLTFILPSSSTELLTSFLLQGTQNNFNTLRKTGICLQTVSLEARLLNTVVDVGLNQELSGAVTLPGTSWE